MAALALLLGMLGAAGAGAEPIYDPTAPPGMAGPQTSPSEAEAERQARAGTTEGLHMVLHRSATAYRGERTALAGERWRQEGADWGPVALERVRRYGVEVQSDGQRTYVPVVGHEVKKRLRRPEELPRLKGQ
ncbi:MAG: hypothetical protein ACLFSI_03755 [Halorhodospira sp.]